MLNISEHDISTMSPFLANFTKEVFNTMDSDQFNTTTAAPLVSDTNNSSPTMHMVNTYAVYILVVIGLVCNVLSFAVFINSHTLRRTTTGHYLIALAVADTGFLVGELLKNLSKYDEDGVYYLSMPLHGRIPYCYATYTMRYVFKFMSAWFTVIITFERFLTVRFPLRVASLSTPHVAKIAIAVVMVISVLCNLFPFWTVGNLLVKGRYYCIVTATVMYNHWNTAVLRVGQLILPSGLVMIFTGLIIYYIVKARRARDTQFQGMRYQKHQKSVEKQLTMMLLSVAVTSLLLRIPYAISYYILFYRASLFSDMESNKAFDLVHGDITYRLNISEKITDIFAVSNYVLNFFLYCLCGSTFRNNLVMLFANRCSLRKKHDQNATDYYKKHSKSQLKRG